MDKWFTGQAILQASITPAGNLFANAIHEKSKLGLLPHGQDLQVKASAHFQF